MTGHIKIESYPTSKPEDKGALLAVEDLHKEKMSANIVSIMCLQSYVIGASPQDKFDNDIVYVIRPKEAYTLTKIGYFNSSGLYDLTDCVIHVYNEKLRVADDRVTMTVEAGTYEQEDEVILTLGPENKMTVTVETWPSSEIGVEIKVGYFHLTFHFEKRRK